MQKILIHVGYPKTGTTWFQKNFYPKVNNYDYFDRGKFKNTFLYKSEESFIDYIKEHFKDGNHILCEEEIINIKEGLSVEEKAFRLKQVFSKPKIIIFVRNQFNILESKYSEYIKSGNTLSFEELIHHLFEINKIRQWDYYNHLKIYFDLFGSENVHIYLFEDFMQDFNNFIQNYINKYNLLINKENINYKKVNVSYKNLILKTARLTNKFSKIQIGKIRKTEPFIFNIPLFHKVTHDIYYELNKIIPSNRFNAKKHLDKKTFNKLCSYFTYGNKKLIEEFNLDLKKYNYPL